MSLRLSLSESHETTFDICRYSVPGTRRKIALVVHFIGISDISIFVVTPLLIFAVYRIDTHGPGFLLLMSPKHRTHERYEGSVIAGKPRAFAWWEGTRRLLAVRNILSSRTPKWVPHHNFQ